MPKVSELAAQSPATVAALRASIPVAVQEDGSVVVAAAKALNFDPDHFNVSDEGLGVAGVALAGWKVAGTWEHSVDGDAANVDFTGLSGSIMVIARGLSMSSSGFRRIHASVDNGSTYLTSSGDYVAVDGNGVESSTTVLGGHSGATTSARTVFTHVISNVAGANSVAHSQLGYILLVASADAINAIRVAASAGVFNGGTITVLVR